MDNVVVCPRLETIAFSLYWKDKLHVETECLPDENVQLEMKMTGAQVLQMVAQKLGWQPVNTLQRLEGFTDPWERLLVRGRELKADVPLADQSVQANDKLVVVRRILKADGWRVRQLDDFLSSDDDDGEESDA